ncbi:hypothetical protein BGZ83_006959 [Gryganskiella cystojenkinii]|nr:hypothetical protein BGZ83_006959 [Gryganskiella cystojenkinii]
MAKPAASKKSSVPQTKAPTSSIKNKATAAVGILLALGAALSYTFVRDIVIDTGLFLGTIQPFNTAGCKVIPGLEACEDVHIHHGSGLAFTTCGNSEARKLWYPAMNKRNDTGAPERAFKDEFVIYDIKTDKYEVMKIDGLPENTDRVFHGLGIYDRSATDLTIFAINHRRGGSVVEVLEYSIGDKVLQYKETIRHPLITTPNDIVAMGPREFYVSNDHRHPSGAMREVEELFRRPWANIVYSSPESTFVAFEGVVSANGMTSNPERTKLFVSACQGGAMHVLEPQPDHTLAQLDHVKLDFYNDNPSYDPASGSVFVTGHVQVLTMVAHLKELGRKVEGPSKVIKMSPNPLAGKGDENQPAYKVETVLVDDGKLISTGTVAAVDRERGVMLIGTAFSDRGLIRCPIPQGF